LLEELFIDFKNLSGPQESNRSDMKLSEPEKMPRRVLFGALRIGHKSIGFKIARGVVSSVARKLIVAPIALFLVPFTLYKVGVAGYGTWAILSTVINLAWLMDPGLGPAVTKYIAESGGKNDIREIQRVIDAGVATCLCMATTAACIVGFSSHFAIKELFRGPAAPQAGEILALWPLVLLCIATFLTSTPFLAVINGCQRMDLTNVLLFSAELLSASMTVAFLLAGAKVKGLLLAQLLSALFILVGSIVLTRRLLPGITPNPLRCKFGTLRKLVTFSVPLYAGYVMTTLQGQLERLYLARMVGVIPVGWYDVASQGAAKVKRIPDLLLGPVLAAASELEAREQREKLEELHFRAHKYLGIVAIPLVVFAVFAARPLVHLWVGNDLEKIAFTFAVLVIGNIFPQMGSPIYFVTVGRGILRPSVYTALLASGLNVVLSYIFIKLWGFSGAALGTAIPMFVSTVYYFIVCRTYFQLDLFQTLRLAYVKPLFCALVAGGTIPLIAFLKLHNWVSLLVDLSLFGPIYLAGLVLTRSIDQSDLATAGKHIPFLARRGAKATAAETAA
jgi:O-antigen/teichoic acid export membrane protein